MAKASYQTAPLNAYSSRFRSVAERVFSLVRAEVGPRHARKEKGSYSFIASSSQETVAKLLIYEAGCGRPMGNWPLAHDGVYVLVQANGRAAKNIWEDIMPVELPEYFDSRLNRKEPISVAPNHNEEFAYFPVMAGESLGGIAVLLRACIDA